MLSTLGPNGCHNRAPLRDYVIEKPGYARVEIPFRMARDCQYTLSVLGQKDQRCAGCRWRVEPPRPAAGTDAS